MLIMQVSNSFNSTYLYQNQNSQHLSGAKNEDETSNAEKTQEKDKKLDTSKAIEELSQGERIELAELQSRDIEVRAHEAAHIAAGGSAVTGGASFTYQKGPDGKMYAIGGEVPISLGGGNTPDEKIANAKAVKAGALAPASPSPQDLKVASSAAMLESQALAQKAKESLEELQAQTKANQAYKDEGLSSQTSTTESNIVNDRAKEDSVVAV